MFGMILWQEHKQRRPAAVPERAVLRLRFWEADISRGARTPPVLVRHRCTAAARQLQRLGVTRAVFPPAFPFLKEFARYNIRPVDPLPMYRALTGELVQSALEEQGQSGRSAVVAVCAGHLTAEVRQAVTALCIRNRYVLLCAPDRNGAFCRQLRREYGAPLVQAEDPEQLRRASVVVQFSPGPGAFPGQRVLELYPGGTLPENPLRLESGEEQLPPGCDRRQLLAALWTGGAVRAGQIGVFAPGGTPEAPEATFLP